MPGGAVRVALAAGLRLSAVRRDAARGTSNAPAVPVLAVPASGVTDCRYDLPSYQAGADHVVCRDLPPDPRQEGHLQPRTGPPTGRVTVHGLEASAQAHAGHAGTRPRQAPGRGAC